MVTTVIIPAIKKMKSKEEQIGTFRKIEGRFALQAKTTTLLTGLTGFYMVYSLNAWDRYFDYRFWWISAMTLVWMVFSLILYILEPLVLHRLFILSAHDISTPAAPFLPMAALKNLAVDCYSGVFSPCPRQKINHRNAKNSHAKSIKSMPWKPLENI